MRALDRTAGILLLLGAAGHTAGTLHWLSRASDAFVWSLGSSLAAALLATLNLVRSGRPTDRTLAWICFAGTSFWAAVVLGFGVSIGRMLDPRVLMHLVASAALVIFSVRTLRRAASVPANPLAVAMR